MGFLAQIQISCFFFSYLVSLGCEAYQVVRRRTSVTRGLQLAFAVAGLFAHTMYLVTRSRQSGLPPLMSSGQDWLLVLAWLGASLYLLLSVTHGKLANGLFMLPAILLLVIVSVFVSDDATTDLQRLAIRRWGLLHAASLVLGMATVLGATLSAVMYLLHHQKLRGHMRWLRRLTLPSLEQLTAVNRWMVILSVPCLTVGLVTGFILLLLDRQTEGTTRIRWTDPTIITTIVVWLAMVTLLVRLLVIRRQSGKAVAQMSLLSGGFLLITIIGPMLLSRTGAISTFHGGRESAASRPPGNAEEAPQP